MAHPNSFGARARLRVDGREFEIFRLDALQQRFDILRLPYTLRILLENVLRHEDGVAVTEEDVEAVAGWVASAEPSQAISFIPGRVIHQDFTGVPAIVDLAAMRDAMKELGGDPGKINPQLPSLLVTDSHTTMINGLGVLGWGVGGIEAEAAMLGEAVSMLVPQVVGFKLMGELPEGATATDLVLTVTQILRETGVVGKFVEYFGHGLERLPVADRATIGNMSPEYGATCGFFPVDAEPVRYLRLTGRPDERIALVEAYCKENALWHDPEDPPTYSQIVDLDLSTVEPSLAGPRRPQDRVPLREAKEAFLDTLPTFGVDYGNSHDEAVAESFPASDPVASAAPGHEPATAEAAATVSSAALLDAQAGVEVTLDEGTYELEHGSVVIAAITSCTNTSNPAVMVAAGLLAK